ncbi:hypothetical protein [Streptomyces sp. HUAS ZL42]|uniref:hypothetical protein n=1 Tax=Streptomyces sp. HUAS ZL42 TaxID=3231715 RepID=UPI00345E696C
MSSMPSSPADQAAPGGVDEVPQYSVEVPLLGRLGKCAVCGLAYLRRRTRPALTVWTSAEAADWENSTLHVTGSRVEHWPGVGRYLHEERPERTVRLIREWSDAV